MASGGYLATVCGHVDEELMGCCICTLLLRQPVQLDCGHVFCKTCIDAHIETKEKNGDDVECPSCREKIVKEMIFQDKNLSRKILSLQVLCRFSDACKWKGDLRHFEDHLEACPMAEITCVHCNEIYRRQDTEVHNTGCIFWPLVCPHACGSLDIPRQHLKEHLQVCTLILRACPYKTIGCTFSGVGIMDRHLSESLDLHLNLTVKKMADNNQKSEGTIKQVEEACSQLNLRLVTSEEECKELKLRLSTSEEVCKELKLSLATSEKERNEIKRKLDISEKQMTRLEQNSVKRCEVLHEKLKQFEDGEKNISMCLLTTSPPVAVHTFNIAPAVNQQGAMVFPIEIKVQNSNGALYTTEYSESFYSGANGYKLQLGVRFQQFDNQRNMVRNQEFGNTGVIISSMCYRIPMMTMAQLNLKLSLHVVKSEIDDELQWPFNINFTYYVLHPKDITKHLKIPFDTKKHNMVGIHSSVPTMHKPFGRPEHERSSGYPISLTWLNNGSYGNNQTAINNYIDVDQLKYSHNQISQMTIGEFLVENKMYLMVVLNH